jgi:hypothetical protein
MIACCNIINAFASTLSHFGLAGYCIKFFFSPSIYILFRAMPHVGSYILDLSVRVSGLF